MNLRERWMRSVSPTPPEAGAGLGPYPVREVPDGPERREGGARGGGGLGDERGGYLWRRRHPPVRAPEVLFPSVLARGSGAGNAVASALQVGVFELLNTSCPTL